MGLVLKLRSGRSKGGIRASPSTLSILGIPPRRWCRSAQCNEGEREEGGREDEPNRRTNKAGIRHKRREGGPVYNAEAV